MESVQQVKNLEEHGEIDENKNYFNRKKTKSFLSYRD